MDTHNIHRVRLSELAIKSYRTNLIINQNIQQREREKKKVVRKLEMNHYF